MKSSIFNNKKVINAIYIGILCSVSYLAVYFARSILGAVTPKMLGDSFNEIYIGKASSVYFIMYAVGQLINGFVGDRIKAKYMISGGLFFAAITNLLFVMLSASKSVAVIAYGLTGFFLSMIYAPMTKVVAENTEPIYATRCSLGYTFASFFGSPLAGLTAVFLAWKNVFLTGSISLAVMALICIIAFTLLEKKVL